MNTTTSEKTIETPQKLFDKTCRVRDWLKGEELYCIEPAVDIVSIHTSLCARLYPVLLTRINRIYDSGDKDVGKILTI